MAILGKIKKRRKPVTTAKKRSPIRSYEVTFFGPGKKPVGGDKVRARSPKDAARIALLNLSKVRNAKTVSVFNQTTGNESRLRISRRS